MNTRDRIEAALRHVPADDRDMWVKMAMAVKSELGDSGLDLWDAWSQTADNYNAKSASDTWKSTSAGGGITLGTLFHLAKEYGWKPEGRYTPPTPEERAQAKRIADAARKKAEAEKQRKRESARANAASILKKAQPATPDNPYLERKQVQPTDNLYQCDVSSVASVLGYPPKSSGEALVGELLLVPVQDKDANITTLEMIDKQGRKTALAGGQKKACYWVTETLSNPETLLIGEGVATVLSASEATGYPAVAALSSGNLVSIAEIMRDKFPASDIVVLADLDKKTGKPDKNATKAAKAVDGRLAVPDFGDEREPGWTDFNDLAVERDLGAVKDCIDAATSLDPISIIDAAVEKLKAGDSGAHWEPEVIEAARELLAEDRALFQRKRSELKKANRDSQITDWTAEVNGSGEQQEQITLADELISAVVEKATLFHTPDGEGFAVFQHDGHFETWGLHSQGFADWCGLIAYKELGFSPSETTLKQALVALDGMAKYDGYEQDVYLRCAPHAGGYVIDLADPDWKVVHVTPDGWNVMAHPPVRFMRSGTSAPLPMPVPGAGDHGLLWKYCNVPEESRLLVLAFILESWRQDTPFTVLQITGEQGSAKSTTHAHIRQVSDPNTVPLRAKPKTVEDVYVSASNNWQASFENMSNLSAAMQDALCTLATGGGFAARRLYTNSEESVIEVKRPVIINGISHVATRPDLIDRLIAVYLPKIPDEAKRKESDIDKAFQADAPAIFTGLLDLFSATLKALPHISLKSTPRMVDFTYLGEAMASALGHPAGTFLSLYRANRKDSLAHSLDSSPAALAIQDMMQARGGREWTGTVKALKEALEPHKHEGEGWPQSPKGLAEILRRMMPALREFGIEVEFLGHKRDGWRVRLYSIPVFLECENDSHNRHTVTPTPPNGQKCDHVTVVTVENGFKKKADGDICPENPSSQGEITL